MMSEPRRKIRVLLIDDSPDDERILRRAMRGTAMLENLQVVDDGDQALEFIRRQGKYEQALRPDLILLDLNLPRRDGWEVMEEIKADRHLKSIPVVVLTTADSEEDVRRAYRLQASCFITKPADFGRLERIMACLDEFWTSVASLPRRGPIPAIREGDRKTD
jgi:CheY-like chemotaxis protein